MKILTAVLLAVPLGCGAQALPLTQTCSEQIVMLQQAPPPHPAPRPRHRFALLNMQFDQLWQLESIYNSVNNSYALVDTLENPRQHSGKARNERALAMNVGGGSYVAATLAAKMAGHYLHRKRRAADGR